MRKPNFRIVPLPTEVAETARRTAASGAPDHAIITANLPRAFPCRHCLRWANPGENVILFPFASIPADRPYAESGPIFLHAKACQRYEATGEYPADFREGRVFRGYNKEHDMIDAVVAHGIEPEAVIEKMLQNPEIAFVHARSVTRGCYTFAIARS